MIKVFLSTSCVKCNHVIDSVRVLAGITKNIELSGGTKHQPDSFALLKSVKEELGLDFLLHSYFPPPESDFILNFADVSLKTRDFICASVQFVDGLATPYYSVHAGYKRSFSFENELLVNGNGHYSLDGIAKNIEWFRQKFPDTPLALENLYPNNRNLDSCFATSVAEIEQILNFDDQVFLLLDFGHLKISAHLLNFDFFDAVELLFSKYGNRIVELHLSENNSVFDCHDILTETSDQFVLLQKYREAIVKNNINLTLEARGKDLAKIQKNYNLIRSLFEEK